MLQSPFRARGKVHLCQVVGEVATWGLGVKENHETTPCRARLVSRAGHWGPDTLWEARERFRWALGDRRGGSGPVVLHKGDGTMLRHCGCTSAAPRPQPPEGLRTARLEGTKGSALPPWELHLGLYWGPTGCVTHSVPNNWILEMKFFCCLFLFFGETYTPLGAGTMQQLKLS